LMFYLWHRKRLEWGHGVLFGIMISTMFSFRFIDEFFKENQEAFEDNMVLNMGQILSIPFILLGLLIIAVRLNKPIHR
ncbi:prolipoprotein diacylglyceryl transferase family protein, partial [Dyadobacter bucti]|uniref:prolipoprotein diacylglyceryl transferase family protein n=1 Tax=Dyadobacter bucti TaxID=2572203 RepID=UPI003F70BC42